MANSNKNKISIVSAVFAFISLLSVYLIPISVYESKLFNQKEYMKLMDGSMIITKCIPIILLVGVIVFSLLKMTTSMLTCSLCYVTLGIVFIYFKLKYSKPCFGLAIIVIEMTLIAGLAILQFRKALAISEKDINVELDADEKLIIKGEKQGIGAGSIGFIFATILGVVLFSGACNRIYFYLTYFDSKLYIAISVIIIAISVIIIVVSIIRLSYFENCTIFVTDKRVCGKTTFNKKFNFKIDYIKSASDIPRFHGVAVATSFGRFKIYYLKNSGDVYSSICRLLVNRQSEDTLKDIPRQQYNDLDYLVKLKKLLDDDIITQEEFDAKKKQVLGL